MRTIYKYVFAIMSRKESEKTIELGHWNKVALVALDPQTGEPAIWIEQYPDAQEKRPVRFFIVGTGHDVPAGDHVGSVVQGQFVWHVYRQDR